MMEEECKFDGIPEDGDIEELTEDKVALSIENSPISQNHQMIQIKSEKLSDYENTESVIKRVDAESSFEKREDFLKRRRDRNERKKKKTTPEPPVTSADIIVITDSDSDGEVPPVQNGIALPKSTHTSSDNVSAPEAFIYNELQESDSSDTSTCKRKRRRLAHRKKRRSAGKDQSSIMDVCKYYLIDCCTKGKKCEYMHAEFPCKFYYLGLRCLENDIGYCKFAHGEPLTDTLKAVLINHVKTLPKDSLVESKEIDAITALDMIENTEKFLKNNEKLLQNNKTQIDEIFDWTKLLGIIKAPQVLNIQKMGLTKLEDLSNLTVAQLCGLNLTLDQISQAQNFQNKSLNEKTASDLNSSTPIKLSGMEFNSREKVPSIPNGPGVAAIAATILDNESYSDESEHNEIGNLSNKKMSKTVDSSPNRNSPSSTTTDLAEKEIDFMISNSMGIMSELSPNVMRILKQKATVFANNNNIPKVSGLKDKSSSHHKLEKRVKVKTEDYVVALRDRSNSKATPDMRLPFKPVVGECVPAIEIDASLSSYCTPIKYKLLLIELPQPDYAEIRLAFMDNSSKDPRLIRIFANKYNETLGCPSSPDKMERLEKRSPRNCVYSHHTSRELSDMGFSSSSDPLSLRSTCLMPRNPAMPIDMPSPHFLYGNKMSGRSNNFFPLENYGIGDPRRNCVQTAGSSTTCLDQIQQLIERSAWYADLSANDKIMVNQNLATFTADLIKYRSEKNFSIPYRVSTPIQHTLSCLGAFVDMQGNICSLKEEKPMSLYGATQNYSNSTMQNFSNATTHLTLGGLGLDINLPCNITTNIITITQHGPNGSSIVHENRSTSQGHENKSRANSPGRGESNKDSNNIRQSNSPIKSSHNDGNNSTSLGRSNSPNRPNNDPRGNRDNNNSWNGGVRANSPSRDNNSNWNGRNNSPSKQTNFNNNTKPSPLPRGCFESSSSFVDNKPKSTYQNNDQQSGGDNNSWNRPKPYDRNGGGGNESGGFERRNFDRDGNNSYRGRGRGGGGFNRYNNNNNNTNSEPAEFPVCSDWNPDAASKSDSFGGGRDNGDGGNSYRGRGRGGRGGGGFNRYNNDRNTEPAEFSVCSDWNPDAVPKSDSFGGGDDRNGGGYRGRGGGFRGGRGRGGGGGGFNRYNNDNRNSEPAEFTVCSDWDANAPPKVQDYRNNTRGNNNNGGAKAMECDDDWGSSKPKPEPVKVVCEDNWDDDTPAQILLPPEPEASTSEVTKLQLNVNSLVEDHKPQQPKSLVTIVACDDDWDDEVVAPPPISSISEPEPEQVQTDANEWNNEQKAVAETDEWADEIIANSTPLIIENNDDDEEMKSPSKNPIHSVSFEESDFNITEDQNGSVLKDIEKSFSPIKVFAIQRNEDENLDHHHELDEREIKSYAEEDEIFREEEIPETDNNELFREHSGRSECSDETLDAPETKLEWELEISTNSRVDDDITNNTEEETYQHNADAIDDTSQDLEPELEIDLDIQELATKVEEMDSMVEMPETLRAPPKIDPIILQCSEILAADENGDTKSDVVVKKKKSKSSSSIKPSSKKSSSSSKKSSSSTSSSSSRKLKKALKKRKVKSETLVTDETPVLDPVAPSIKEEILLSIKNELSHCGVKAKEERQE